MVEFFQNLYLYSKLMVFIKSLDIKSRDIVMCIMSAFCCASLSWLFGSRQKNNIKGELYIGIQTHGGGIIKPVQKAETKEEIKSDTLLFLCLRVSNNNYTYFTLKENILYIKVLILFFPITTIAYIQNFQIKEYSELSISPKNALYLPDYPKKHSDSFHSHLCSRLTLQNESKYIRLLFRFSHVRAVVFNSLDEEFVIDIDKKILKHLLVAAIKTKMEDSKT